MLTFLPDALDIAPEVLQAVSAVPTLRGYGTPPSGIDLGVAALSGTSLGGALLYTLSGGNAHYRRQRGQTGRGRIDDMERCHADG
ncbi:MAG: hypothetical protein IPI51_07405 [Betaproteobacteria bacterium]|nr:hypothetical protein [Betaproteobacteria bacterium]